MDIDPFTWFDEHFRNPRHAGSLPAGDTDVGTGRVEDARSGDVTRPQVRIDKTSHEILDARFKAYGCSFTIASASFITDLVIGRTMVSALAITLDEINEALSLPVTKRYCAELARDAMQLAVVDYETKQDAQAHVISEQNR